MTGPDVPPEGADPEQWARFCAQRDQAAQIITDALAALLADDQERAMRVLDPVADSSGLWFLTTSGAVAMLAAVLPAPLEPHECENPVCPVAADMLNLWLDGQTGLVRRLLLLTGMQGSAGKRMELLGYMLSGLEMAVQAGVVLPPAPSATLGPQGRSS